MTDLIDTSTLIADLRAGTYRAGSISVITLIGETLVQGVEIGYEGTSDCGCRRFRF